MVNLYSPRFHKPMNAPELHRKCLEEESMRRALKKLKEMQEKEDKEDKEKDDV